MLQTQKVSINFQTLNYTKNIQSHKNLNQQKISNLSRPRNNVNLQNNSKQSTNPIYNIIKITIKIH